MPYTVIIEDKAQREFLRLSASHDKAVRKAIDSLEKQPRRQGVKKLVGTKDGYRIRVGLYRILFTIDDHRQIVTIYRIRHRKEAYR